MDNWQQAHRDFLVAVYGFSAVLILVGIVLETSHRVHGGTLAVLRFSHVVTEGTIVAREKRGRGLVLRYEYIVEDGQRVDGRVILPVHFTLRFQEDTLRVARSTVLESVSMPTEVMDRFETDRIIWLSSFGFFGAATLIILLTAGAHVRFLRWLRRH